MGKKLTGDRNQCRGCGEYFNSAKAFDRHRRGDFGNEENPRRCLSPYQMAKRGMAKNADGFWVTELNTRSFK
ncbi:FDXHR family putative zinc-binding protein [Burkholderia vietnamiensis]|uniref:FDXHR family putative zinc-binding protein n=1 Tax=Burkholderia vietnamiensis TaxID=60552 RepID=UPI00264CD695|nr:hypothetical protein [Burkholderia vietnamiensis]MDN8037425.1 hypothetical protein [Burkholderia vietnamiensis]